MPAMHNNLTCEPSQIDTSSMHVDEVFELQIAPDRAPYSWALARLGITRFELEDRQPTPVDEDGLVDIPEQMRQLNQLVGPYHRWVGPFFDAHHVYGPFNDFIFKKDEENFLSFRTTVDEFGKTVIIPGLEYTAEEREIIQTTEEFHESPENVIGIPRTAHDGLHAGWYTAERPAIEVMRRKNKEARRKKYLYRVANNASAIHESLHGIVRKVDSGGNVMWVDTKRRRTYQGDDAPVKLETQRDHFILQILKQYRKGLIDLSSIAPLESVDVTVLAENMRGAARVLEDGLVYVSNRKVLASNFAIQAADRDSYRKHKKISEAA